MSDRIRVAFPKRNRFNHSADILQRTAMAASPLSLECALCGITSDLQRCSECKVVLYCSRDHQTKDYETHRPICKEISSALETLHYEENIIKESQDYPIKRSPSEILADGMTKHGECHCILQAHRYILARFGVMNAYRQANTYRSLTLATNTALETHLLAPCDPLSMRDVTANLLLRQHRYQEAYDFIKWWILNNDFYCCHQTNPGPVLETTDSDVMESTDVLFRKHPMIHITVLGLAIIKIRLLNDIKNLRNAQLLREKLNYDCIDLIKKFTIDCNLLTKRHDIRCIDSIEKYNKIIDSLENDLDEIFQVCGSRHPLDHFQLWASLAGAYTPQVKIESLIYNAWEDEDKHLIVETVKATWKETPGAQQWIKTKLDEVGYPLYVDERPLNIKNNDCSISEKLSCGGP